MRIAQTTPTQLLAIRPVNRPRISITQHDISMDVDRIVEHFVRFGVLRPGSQVTIHVRKIFAAPSDALRVTHIARRMGLSRRTLGRRFRAEGVPPPVAWIGLARAAHAHRRILRGGLLQEASDAAGYPDQFTMSNAIHRIIGLRPSRLREVSPEGMLDVWIARQRERGALTGPSPPRHTCPLCGQALTS
jgi:AraC-like DNA-binding protein